MHGKQQLGVVAPPVQHIAVRKALGQMNRHRAAVRHGRTQRRHWYQRGIVQRWITPNQIGQMPRLPDMPAVRFVDEHTMTLQRGIQRIDAPQCALQPMPVVQRGGFDQA